MADNILKFTVVPPSDNAVSDDVDSALASAKAAGFETIFVIGELPDGRLETMSNTDVYEALALMERAKHFLLFDED